MKDASEILDSAESRQERVQPHVRDAAELFHDEEGSLFTRSEALEMVQDECGIGEDTASDVLAELVGDTVDPVVQVIKGGVKYIGVIEFHEFDGAYGYVQWHDEFGARKRVVCQQCVNEAKLDKEVTHATEGVGSFRNGADFDTLLDAIHEHYQGQWDEDEGEYIGGHDVMPEEVETGASLASGTTIGGKKAFHAGNDGSGSNLDADTLDGTEGSGFVSGDVVTTGNHSSNNDIVVEPPFDWSTYNRFVITFRDIEPVNGSNLYCAFRRNGSTVTTSDYADTVQIQSTATGSINESAVQIGEDFFENDRGGFIRLELYESCGESNHPSAFGVKTTAPGGTVLTGGGATKDEGQEDGVIIYDNKIGGGGFVNADYKVVGLSQ